MNGDARGLLILWALTWSIFIAFAYADGELRQRIDLLNERLTVVEARR